MYRVSNLLNARKHRRRMPKVHVSVQESPRKNERGKTQRRRELSLLVCNFRYDLISKAIEGGFTVSR